MFSSSWSYALFGNEFVYRLLTISTSGVGAAFAASIQKDLSTRL